MQFLLLSIMFSRRQIDRLLTPEIRLSISQKYIRSWIHKSAGHVKYAGAGTLMKNIDQKEEKKRTL